MTRCSRRGQPLDFRARTKEELFLDIALGSWHSLTQWRWCGRRRPPPPPLPFPNLLRLPRPRRPGALARALRRRSRVVLSRPVPAAPEGRPRPAARHRRRHRRDARPLGRDLRLRLEQALFREMVERGARGERRQVARRGARHARPDRRRQAHRHRLRRRGQAHRRRRQDRRRRRMAEGHRGRLHRLLPGRALREALARSRIRASSATPPSRTKSRWSTCPACPTRPSRW